MTGKKKWMGLIMMLVLVSAPAAFGADVTAAVDLNSAYVWRGITLNEGWVAQPSLDVASNGFDINVWANYDIDDNDGALEKTEFSEVDLTASYSRSLGPVDLTGGIIEYLFPATHKSATPSTQEVFLGISVAPIKQVEGFTTGITGYYDFDEVNDFYLNPYAKYSMDFGQGFSMDLGASCGYVGEDFLTKVSRGHHSGSGFHEYTVTAGTGYAIDPFKFSARLGYTDSLDNDVLPDQEVNLFGGVGVAMAF